MSGELHRADPGMRRFAIVAMGSAALLGVAAIVVLRRWLASSSTEVDGLIVLAAGLVVVLSTVSLGLAYALWQEAANIRREDCFPPSDMRTLRDVIVRHGAEARRYAQWMRVGAVVAGACGLGILIWGYRLLRLIA